MLRIVAGAAKGRRLVVPQGATRPTSDRMREALFSTLQSLTSLIGARFLDLYAGSGAVGLEALSRGAEQVALVESDPRVLSTLKANIATVDLPAAQLVSDKVERLARRRPAEPFTIVFADPPYALGSAVLTETIATIDAAGWFSDDVLIVIERSSRDTPWIWPAGFTEVQHRRYGEGTLWYGRRT